MHNDDLDPALNTGAVYFMEAHYITADDALAGNGNNNASYRRIVINGPNDTGILYRASATGLTHREQPAIRAWQDTDPSVVETDVQVPDEGLFILAAKAIDLSGTFRYEYVLQNLNSDLSSGSFSVPLPVGVSIDAVGFHDVDYHSGEPWHGTDWLATVSEGMITWRTSTFDVDPNANALRWGTLYNFRFEANTPPDETTVTLGLFKPGNPDTVAATTIGPAVGLIDCNGNDVQDACDIDCAVPGCTVPCGDSLYCDANGVPD